MEREIKFRAWHIEEKLMCEVDNLNSKGAFLLGVKKGKDQFGNKWIAFAPEDGRFCLNGEFELMQFTGLKDKNGKKIYEEDIVDISKFEGSAIYRMVINDIMQMPNELYGSNVDWYEVIGNRIENPELLK